MRKITSLAIAVTLAAGIAPVTALAASDAPQHSASIKNETPWTSYLYQSNGALMPEGTWPIPQAISLSGYASYQWNNSAQHITFSQSTTVFVKAAQSSSAGDKTWVQYQLRKVGDSLTYYYDDLKGVYSQGSRGTASIYVPAGKYYVSVSNGSGSTTSVDFYLTW